MITEPPAITETANTSAIQINSTGTQPVVSAFRHAFNGLWYFITHERNGKIQGSAAVVCVCTGLWLHINAAEWTCILLCIGTVLAMEMMNSALEKLCDLVEPNYNPVIKIVKDVAAAAVLWLSIISMVIAAVIFLPKLFIYV